ncbi:MAG: hypothetical protein AMXMBFR19_16900 [Chthonomonadaceae bacterium]|uniref:Uncharacterized protein n=1 Tax=Candidatus Nitrosymbiomonas proteolyticus TaxID=2608984 RepID=A0A809S529_9BACT|nr:hypothetical protein NPRO_15820 [Candidatus Nitrosymbiomonas proteolyticus]
MRIEMQEPYRGRGMKIDPKNITVRELVEGFSGRAEEGALRRQPLPRTDRV